MQITVKEAKKVGEGTKKDGKPWKLYAVVNEDGIEYTTFDTKAGHITPGAVIEIGDITLKDGDKRSFKELVVISEGPASGPKPNCDMSKKDWVKKQRIERDSFEAQTAYIHLPIYLQMDYSELSERGKELWEAATQWCEAKIDANMGQTSSKAPATETKAPKSTKPPAEGLTFKNVGEFLAACNNAGVPRNKVMEKLGVDEKSLSRINIAESWDIIYEELIKPSKELMK